MPIMNNCGHRGKGGWLGVSVGQQRGHGGQGGLPLSPNLQKVARRRMNMRKMGR
jgi:hypothetical protein